MVLGIGTDIIEVKRIEKSIENELFIKKVFTENEEVYCNKKINKAQSYAARFAAKEAFAKALGSGFRGEITLSEIEVLNDELGKPFIKTYGKTTEYITKKKVKHIHLSLSHINEMAIAFVIVEI